MARPDASNAWVLCVVAALAACGKPAPRTPSPPAPLVVEVKPPPEEPVQAVAQDDAAPPTREASTLAECVELIQDGRNLSAPGNDRALYEKALSEQRAGDLADARKSYYELIQASPASPFIPLAFLAFADQFMKEAEQKPSMTSLAVAAYTKVTTFPPPRNTAYTYALYRIAQAQQHDHPTEALSYYVKAVSGAPLSPCPDALERAARQGLTATYVGVGRPDRAWPFFRRTAPDDATAAKMLADLVHRYEAAGKPDDACRAVRAASASARASEPLKTTVSRCARAPRP